MRSIRTTKVQMGLQGRRILTGRPGQTPMCRPRPACPHHSSSATRRRIRVRRARASAALTTRIVKFSRISRAEQTHRPDPTTELRHHKKASAPPTRRLRSRQVALVAAQADRLHREVGRRQRRQVIRRCQPSTG